MAWEIEKDSQGRPYVVDWLGIAGIVKAYCRAKAMNENGHLKSETHFMGPDIYSVEYDWDKIKRDAEDETETLLQSWYRDRNFRLYFDLLASYRKRTRKYEEQTRALQRKASKDSMANIEKSVHRAENTVTALKFVRDASATFEVAASSLVPGGAVAAGALIGGSAFKGFGKYQDTGNIGSATLEMTTTCIVGVLDLPVATKGADKVAKWALKIVATKIDSVNELGQTLIEGKSLKEAAAAVAAGGGYNLGENLLEDLEKTAVFGVAKITHINHRIVEATFKTASSLIKDKLVVNGVKQFAGGGGKGERKSLPGVEGGPIRPMPFVHHPSATRIDRFTSLHVLATGPGLDLKSDSDVVFVRTTAIKNH